MAIDDIVHETTVAQPPEIVWRVIATKEGLDAWFMENDFEEAVVGHEFQFRDRPRPFWNGICDCKVLEADPPHRFALAWNHKQDKEPSKVAWTLTRTSGGGTHIELRHSGLHGFMGLMMKRGMTKGWGRIVARSVPFAAERLAAGGLPTKQEVDAHTLGTEAARAR